MATQSTARTRMNAAGTSLTPRWLVRLGLGLVLAAVGISAILFLTRAPANSFSGRAASQAMDPAQTGVMSYLQAHALSAPIAADPVQAGVMSYLRAHALPASIAVDPAQVGVDAYIRAHALPASVADPAQQGVMSYLQAHGGSR